MDDDFEHDEAIGEIDNEYLHAIARASVIGRRRGVSPVESEGRPSVLALLRNPELRSQPSVETREKQIQ